MPKYSNKKWIGMLNESQTRGVVSDSAQSAGSVPMWIKIKLRKAIHYIHNEDDYEKGIDVIAGLAGIEINETGDENF